MLKATRLKTIDLYNPIGIDMQPYFCWNLEGDSKTQTAYELHLAADQKRLEEGNFIWESGKVNSTAMRNITCGREMTSREKGCWQVRIYDEKDVPGPWSEPVAFEMGLLKKEDWKAQWISGNYIPEKGVRYPADEFRKSFLLPEKKIASARLYMTACGCYETFLDGTKAGNLVLAPGSTNYNVRVQYQTYDVTKMLIPGENHWDITLGDGWFRGKTGAFGASCVYGDTTAVLGQLEICFEDGTSMQVVTDQDFSWCNDGPVRFNDMKDGEDIDMNCYPSYGGNARSVSYDGIICASNNVPVIEHETFSPKLLVTSDGSQVLDFGQNIAGLIAFTVKGEKGRRMNLRFGEMLDENGNFTVKNLITEDTTSPYIPDYCDDSRFQSLNFICSGKGDYYKSRLTVYGFQYVKLENWPQPVDPSDFKAIAVYSDMEMLMDFHCSAEEVNKLVENTLWSIKGNHLDVPTDCPTRERSAWLGDAQLFFETGSFFTDQTAFYRKWMKDIYDDQAEDGKVYNIVPRCADHTGMNAYVEGSSGWCDAGILIPYRYWKQYGEISALEDQYEGMKKLIGFMLSRMGDTSDPELDQKLPESPWRKYIVTTGFHFGEWNEPGSDMTEVMAPKYEEATAYLAYSLSCMEKIALAIHKEEDAKEYAQLASKVKEAYCHYFVTEDGIKSDRMCKYVRPLALGLIADQEIQKKAAAELNQLVLKGNYHVGTGFLSTPFLLPVLSEYGYNDTAYKMLLCEEYPSWLYEVEQGATTIWENWDGIASRNHYSNGAVCQWIFETMCGIRLQKPQHFVIAPVPSDKLTEAKAAFESPYGTVFCGWKRENDKYIYTVEIPAGCTAKLKLPGMETELEAGRYTFCTAYGNSER